MKKAAVAAFWVSSGSVADVLAAEQLGVAGAASATTLHGGRVGLGNQLETMRLSAGSLLLDRGDLVGRDGTPRIGVDDAGTAYAFDHHEDLIGHLSSDKILKKDL